MIGSQSPIDLDAALAQLGAYGTLLAGAAIQGTPRHPPAPLQTVAFADHAAVHVWSQHRRGRRFSLVTAGAAMMTPPSNAELAELVAAATVAGEPDVLHLFVDVIGRSRVLMPPRAAGYACHVRRTSYRYVLPLADDYETFVQALGKHSRRNVRLYQRRAEEDGLAFAFHAGPPPGNASAVAERAEVGRHTRPQPKTARRLAELDAFAAARRRSFHSTVRGGDGRLLSVATGFVVSTSAYLVTQANHGGHPDANLGLMHRSHLIRALIDSGIRDFVFANGIHDILRNACRRDVAAEYLLVREGRGPARGVAAWLQREPSHPAARFLAGVRAGTATAGVEDDLG